MPRLKGTVFESSASSGSDCSAPIEPILESSRTPVFGGFHAQTPRHPRGPPCTMKGPASPNSRVRLQHTACPYAVIEPCQASIACS